jgi:hypothetical protein
MLSLNHSKKKVVVIGRCCVISHTVDGVNIFSLSKIADHASQCTNTNTNDMRVLKQEHFLKLAKYQPIPDAGVSASDVFPAVATNEIVVCAACRIKVGRWDPVIPCSLCPAPATVSTVRNLGHFAKKEDDEDGAWKVCAKCFSRRRRMGKSVKNLHLQSPSKQRKREPAVARDYTLLSTQDLLEWAGVFEPPEGTWCVLVVRPFIPLH